MIISRPAQLSDYTGSSVSPEWITELIDQKAFKLFVPEELGGLQANLVEASQFLAKTAEHHGSLGWMHNLGAGANYFCGFFTPETAAKLFSPKEAITSGSGAATGNFSVHQDHYKLTGCWDKCTGAQFASLFTGNATDEKGNTQSFIIPRSLVEISSSWSSFGLKNSSSDRFCVKNIQLPKEYTFEIGQVKSFHEYFIYYVPFTVFARFCLSASFEGIVRCFINHTKLTLEHKHEQLKDIYQRLEEELEELNQHRELLGKELEAAVTSKINLNDTHCSKIAVSLADRHFSIFQRSTALFWHGGMALTDEEQLAHWAFRDVLTAIQHYMIK